MAVRPEKAMRRKKRKKTRMAISKLFALNTNTMMQLWQKGKNPTFEPSLGTPKFFPWVLPLLVVRQCFKLSSYAISRKTNGPNLKKWQKNLILGLILARFIQIYLQVLPPLVAIIALGDTSSSKLSTNAFINEK